MISFQNKYLIKVFFYPIVLMLDNPYSGFSVTNPFATYDTYSEIVRHDIFLEHLRFHNYSAFFPWWQQTKTTQFEFWKSVQDFSFNAWLKLVDQLDLNSLWFHVFFAHCTHSFKDTDSILGIIIHKGTAYDK